MREITAGPNSPLGKPVVRTHRRQMNRREQRAFKSSTITRFEVNLSLKRYESAWVKLESAICSVSVELSVLRTALGNATRAVRQLTRVERNRVEKLSSLSHVWGHLHL